MLAKSSLLLLLIVNVVIATATNSISLAQKPDLSQCLRAMADEAIAHCKANDVQSIGVLKFLVVKNNADFSDKVGTINSLLARRLEVAMVLANDPLQPVTLIDDASSVAQQIEGVTHLTADGRRRLLDAEYPTMWGNQKIKPDLLVSGIASVSPDLKTITLSLVGIGKNGEDLISLGTDHTAIMKAGLLSEVGESFISRGGFDGGKIQTKNGASGTPPTDLPSDGLNGNGTGSNPDSQTLTAAKNVREQAGAAHPLRDSNPPVRLQVFYDGALIPFEFEGGTAKVREPWTGQRVELAITKDSTSTPYAVVVKVNGQNTLSKQTLPDQQCRKWVLQHPGTQVRIRGYQLTNEQVESFRVLDKTESKDREIDYGKSVGTLSITVFAQGTPPALELDEDKRESQVVETSQLPEKPSSTFGALKAKLLADANRGLIAEGNLVPGQVRAIQFVTSPTPVMTATATYYQP
jgi:hypothetical protein